MMPKDLIYQNYLNKQIDARLHPAAHFGTGIAQSRLKPKK
jgi:hypothetical protein